MFRSQILIQVARPELSTMRGPTPALCKWTGGGWLLQQRTTSQDIAGPEAPFWQSLEFDAQTAGYLLAHDQMGQRLAGVAYEVVRRPEIRPRLVPKGSARRSTEESWGTITEMELGTYCGRPLPEPGRRVNSSRPRDANHCLYSACGWRPTPSRVPIGTSSADCSHATTTSSDGRPAICGKRPARFAWPAATDSTIAIPRPAGTIDKLASFWTCARGPGNREPAATAKRRRSKSINPPANRR